MREQQRIERSSSPDDAPIPLEADSAPAQTPAKVRPIAAPLSTSPAMPAAKQSAAKAPPVLCPRCKYDIRNLKGDTCPECGTSLLSAIRTQERKARARGDLKRVYVQATKATMAALALMAGVLLLKGEISDFPMYLIRYAVFVPIGLVVFAVCSAIWIGFDQPFGITALRLAAIYAIADAVGEVVRGIPLAQFIVPALVYIGLLIKWLELDSQDAVILAVVTGAIRSILLLIVFTMLIA
jgi:hypothetical protein